MRIFSGIQPTGTKHLGNYIGAIRQYVEGQDRVEAIYFISDLHADILLYQPGEVAVGDDHRQHLELARDIAERFNANFGETFVVPRHRMPEVGARIMDLQAPDTKMSTTAPTQAGVVLLLDDDKTIE